MTAWNLFMVLLACSTGSHALHQTTLGPQTAPPFFSPMEFKSGSNVEITDTTQLDISISTSYPDSLQNAKLPPGFTLPSGYKQKKASTIAQTILLQDYSVPTAPKLVIKTITSTDGNGSAQAVAQPSSASSTVQQPSTTITNLSVDCATVSSSPQIGESTETAGKRSDCALFESSTATAQFLNSLAVGVTTAVPSGTVLRLFPIAIISLPVRSWAISLTQVDGSKSTFALSGTAPGTDDMSFTKFSGTCVVDQQAATVTIRLTSLTHSSQTLPDGSVVKSDGTLTMDVSRVLTVTQEGGHD